MSQIQKVFLGAVAIAATLGAVQVGAVQLASGHDLADRWEAVADQPGRTSGRNLPGHNVNRTGKSDRLADLKPAAVPTRTVSMRLNDLPDTSVLLRVPAVIETGNAKPAPSMLKPGRKPTIACEPMVSSLTEVAKLLQPGRCVT
ncbi:hypothetical protein ACFQZO_21895 [Bradyrhizobium sp. GCM10027634]|uniref:hypothetical protein n=1 Tax=unclassified Bradyrhizobium TaxID=2631580 RepID=UPI00188A198F|nr:MULTISPECIES: hypothetical protein [unclassified Bradyrhizobium]MDN5003488.1 hypothetical protein [Bradyrhizobium sp. WYCCWR 12677]QOZ47954.1 hypothetical protein XH89_34075 [Bradyrhizobium sp. CCBAU 53340]